jgi:tryptophan synthase alpha chain
MNRIKTLFRQKQQDILSVYFTAGYPALNDTTAILAALQNQGADLVEIGIPFSDPMADGPVIQESSHKALANGMSIKLLFEQLTDIRKEIQLPLVMMGYLNPVMQFGFEAFCSECNRVGVDGMIIPDLPMSDYLEEYKSIADRYDLKFIFLITPETSEERIRIIDENTDGFIYMVSSAAVTGAQSSFDNRLSYFDRINAMGLKNPRLIGFGVSNKATFDAVNQHASGAIVGSAFIKILEQFPVPEKAVGELLRVLKV